MCFNPMLTTAENFAFIIQRDEEQRSGQDSDMVSHFVQSIPNGQHYGKEGHIPCYHTAVFKCISIKGVTYVKKFDKDGNWTKQLRTL